MSENNENWKCTMCGHENTGCFCCECGFKRHDEDDNCTTDSTQPEYEYEMFPADNQTPFDPSLLFVQGNTYPNNQPAFGMMSEPFFLTLYKTHEENKFLPKSRYKCGCYTCCKIFDPHKIASWIDDKYAVCPFCNSPTIVGEISFESVDLQVLDKLNRYYIKKECVDGCTPPGYACDDSPWVCPNCNAEIKGGLYCFTCGTRNPNAVKV